MPHPSAIADRAEHAAVDIVAMCANVTALLLHLHGANFDQHEASASAIWALSLVSFLVRIADMLSVDATLRAARFAQEDSH